MDEALETIKLAWNGGAVVKTGRNFDAAGNEPRPAPRPQPAVWIGGGSDKAVERAARWGDGWSPFFTAPTLSANNRASAIQDVAHLREKIAVLRDLRAELGRTGPFDIVIAAQAQVREATRAEADRYLQAVGVLAEAGVNWISAGLPHPSRAAYLESAQWFGEEVIVRA
jgi:alkanesulfonate monooxygenase SsuD/methylene tetrahydromethanopterin reductase-like flavin-dependent oxidoreductase (luciferase family)